MAQSKVKTQVAEEAVEEIIPEVKAKYQNKEELAANLAAAEMAASNAASRISLHEFLYVLEGPSQTKKDIFEDWAKNKGYTKSTMLHPSEWKEMFDKLFS